MLDLIVYSCFLITTKSIIIIIYFIKISYLNVSILVICHEREGHNICNLSTLIFLTNGFE